MKYFFLTLIIVSLSSCTPPGTPPVQTETTPSTSEVKTSDYYADLAKTCTSDSENTCCIDSVELMRTGGYKEKSGESCPEGYAENSQECSDAKVWCAPMK